MGYDVRVEQFRSRPLAVTRHRASLHELGRVVPEACGEVWKALRAGNVADAGRHVAVYPDDEINLEVGAEVDAPFAGDGKVVGSATPGGTVATTVHLGPYDQLHAAHQAIHRFCSRHGLTVAGPNWEIYDHWKEEWKEDPSRIRTDVYYLLKADHGAAT